MLDNIKTVRFTEEDENRINKIILKIQETTGINITRSEVIRLGIRKLEHEYLEQNTS